MNTIDIIILLLIAAAVFLAIRHMIRTRGNGCYGDCASCHKTCTYADADALVREIKERNEENHDR